MKPPINMQKIWLGSPTYGILEYVAKRYKIKERPFDLTEFNKPEIIEFIREMKRGYKKVLDLIEGLDTD